MSDMNLAGLKPWAGLAGNPLEAADVVVAEKLRRKSKSAPARQ